MAIFIFFLGLFLFPLAQSLFLSPNFELKYNLSDSVITLTMTAHNQGYVGFGFGSSMLQSELFICSMNSQNLPTLSHFNSTADSTPSVLNLQPVTLISGFRNTTHTSCTFSRSIEATSLGSFNVTAGTSMNVLYAYGSADDYDYHTERGSSNVSFYECGSYCSECDGENQICLACRSPTVMIGSDCQLSLQISENISFSYYLIDSNTKLSMNVTAKNQGYVSVGLGATMLKADIFECGLNGSQWEAFEYKSTKDGRPTLDPIQNILLVAASRNATHTSCSFVRELKTSDPNDTAILLDQTQSFIWGYGSSDSFHYHFANRGAFNITVSQSLDYNNNASLCQIGGSDSRCEECMFGNFAPGLDGVCEENLIKDTKVTITSGVSLFYYVENNQSLSMTLVAEAQGYISIGFGQSMIGADIFMCRRDPSTTEWKAVEMKSSTEDTPTVDAIQNVVLLFAFRNSTHTICSFQRDLKTNDSSDTVITLGKETSLIWALGQTDDFDYHPSRGQFNMVFNNNSVPICDNLCVSCEANNLCSQCKYENFIVVNGSCQEDLEVETNVLKSTNFSLFYYLLPDNNNIIFTAVSNSTGWVGVSLIPAQGSTQELVICNLSTNNTWELVKYYYSSSGSIQKADSQNVQLLNCQRNNGNTICSFLMPIASQVSSDVPIAINQVTNISYGFSNSDSFSAYTEQGEIAALIFNTTCSQTLCSQCNNENTECLTCKYENYYLESGQCVENYTMEKLETLSDTFSFYYFLQNDSIAITLVAESQGYIALGFGKTMFDAQVVMCNKSQNGLWGAYEYVSTGESTPSFDPTQDIEFLNGDRNSTHTLCSFRRKISGMGSKNQAIVLNQDNDLICAIGGSDEFILHTSYASGETNFSNLTAVCPSNCLKCNSDSQCIQCQSSNDIIINGECQSNNDLAPLPSSAVIVENFLSLSWNFSDDNTSVTIMINTSNQGYMSLGIGECMANCDVHVIEYDSNNNALLRDMFSNGDKTPFDDTSNHGTNDLKLLGFGTVNGFKLVKYSRKINTGDQWDFTLDQGRKEMAYAYSGGKQLEFHNDNKGTFYVDFVQGYQGAVEVKAKSSLAKIHGILLFVVWCGLIDIALIFGRYLKTFKWYIETHGILMAIVCIVSVVMESLLIYKHREGLGNLAEQEKLVVAHFIIGVIMMGLFCLEVFYGLIVQKIIEKKTKFINPTIHKLLHQMNGIIIYCLGKADIGIGLQLYKDSQYLVVPLIIFYVLLMIVKAVIEFVYQLEPNFLKTQPKQMTNTPLLLSELVTKLNHNVPREQLIKEFQQFNWIILDRKVYEISNFRHPGGNYILEQTKGREIGRFFYGVCGLETLPIPGHKHTIYSMNFLNSRLIGEIENPLEMPLVKRKETDCSEVSIWRIAEKIEISKATAIFRFKSNEFKVKNFIPGVEWFGRHFAVEDADGNNKLTRLYTTVLCLSAQNINIREKLLKVHNEKNALKKFPLSNVTKNTDGNDFEFKSTCDELTLVIKKYNNPKAFSSHLHHNLNGNYLIRGNFGNGLELTAKSSGVHYIFAGGTGILPFLDLFDYLLKKAIFTDFRQCLSEEEVHNLNPYSENYADTFNNGFKLVLFASFANDEEFLGADIISKLYEIVKEKGYGWFDLKVRIGGKETKYGHLPQVIGYFDREFLNANVNKDENIARVYVCGPPVMNRKMQEELVEFGLEESLLCFV